MSYYMLFTREQQACYCGATHTDWAPQFGDYDREVVAQEAYDSYGDIPKADRKIVKLAAARQAYVNAALRLLNR